MSRPLFSCVVPVKGARPFIADALASLEAQGMGAELEIIVQDGDIEPDSGQSDALNKGFAKANGEWFFWLNADDVLLPGALKKICALISSCAPSTSDEVAKAPCTSAAKPHESTLSWIAGNTVYIDENGTVIEVRCDAKWRPWFGKHMSAWTGGPSAFFRRELWQAHGNLDVDLKYVMDLDLWTRWARAGIRFKGLNEYLWGFRVHGGSATNKISNRREIEREFHDVLRRFNICHEKFWRNVTRLTSLFDGSRWRKIKDSYSFRGTGLFDCVGRIGCVTIR